MRDVLFIARRERRDALSSRGAIFEVSDDCDCVDCCVVLCVCLVWGYVIL